MLCKVSMPSDWYWYSSGCSSSVTKCKTVGRELHLYHRKHGFEAHSAQNIGSFCKYRRALYLYYFRPFVVRSCLELFCFRTFVSFVLRHLYSGTHRRNQNIFRLSTRKGKLRVTKHMIIVIIVIITVSLTSIYK